MATILEGKVSSLQIMRMPEGGFLVMDRCDYGDFSGPRFAATSIEETLKYCKRKLDAEHTEAQ